MSEQTAAPQGKSLFYRSPASTRKEAQLFEEDTQRISAMTEEFTHRQGNGRERLILYDQLNESIQRTLTSAIQLLELADKTRITALSVADSMIAEAQVERERLSREIDGLIRRRDELRDQVAQTRDEVAREEAALKELESRRDALRVEIGYLEKRHHLTVEALRNQLAAIERLKETVRETSAIRGSD